MSHIKQIQYMFKHTPPRNVRTFEVCFYIYEYNKIINKECDFLRFCEVFYNSLSGSKAGRGIKIMDKTGELCDKHYADM